MVFRWDRLFKLLAGIVGVLVIIFAPTYIGQHYNPWGVFNDTIGIWGNAWWIFGAWKILCTITALLLAALSIGILLGLFIWLTDGETP